MSTKNILIVEDEEAWRKILKRGYSRIGVNSDVASSYSEAIKLANSKKYEVCVLDSLEGDCFPLHDELLSLNPNNRVVLFTGNFLTYNEGISRGIESYNKPNDLDKLFELVK